MYNYLAYILEFLDTSQKGFLPGDISVELLQRMEQPVEKAIEELIM